MPTTTIQFDHHSARFARDGAAVIDELHAADSLVYTAAHGGYWVTTRMAVAKEILSDPITFSSRRNDDGSGGVTIPTSGPTLVPAEVDPPYHTAIRRALGPLLSKKGIEAVRARVERAVDSTLDDVIERGEFDAARDLAWVVAPLTIIDWLGLPAASREGFVHAVRDGLASEVVAKNPEAAFAAFTETITTIQSLIADRQQSPADDLTSYLAHHADPRFSDDELLWLIFTLLLGGIENTAALITNSLLELSEDPQLKQRLMNDRSLIPAATEEFLRYYSPGVSLGRNVTRDVEIGGQQLRAGERVLVLVPAANRDDEAFPDPHVIDINRANNPHLSFGHGAHYCAGVWLARMEFHYLLNQIFDRIPDFTIDRARGVRYEDAGIMNGWSSLPATTGRQANT